MSDSSRPSKHTSRTSRGGGASDPAAGQDLPGGRRKASSWVGASSQAGTSSHSAASDDGSASGRRAARRAAASGATARRRGFWGGLGAAMNYPRAGKKRGWRWFPSLRMIIGACALLVLVGVGGLAAVYASTSVPKPDDIAVAQTSRVYFSDGKTEIGTFSEVNRTIIPSDQIPASVKNAVVASEDSTFYENRGVSPRGIIRALVNNVRGGARQGGSTITQQYVERYYTGTDTSYTGKVKEMMMALKIDQQVPKDEILSRYLNTIYFGRGAYGIQAAAQAYYGKDAKDLTDGEAAVLVALIPGPTQYDPAVHHDKAVQLWKRVINREVNETKTLTADQAKQIQYPEPVERQTKKNRLSGTNGYLLRLAQKELNAAGISDDELNRGGFTIVTTIDQKVQDNTVKAIANLPSDRPANNRVGTVTEDPKTGAIRGMYGGADYVQRSFSDATDAHMQAGSIFKTFTLVAALSNGYSLNSTWDGNSPKDFPGWTVKNFGDESYGQISLADATTNSVNTAYGALNIEMGPKKTHDMATTLGLPEKTPGLDDDVTNVLGSASPTVMNMAGAYATIAAQGVRHEPYAIEKVTSADGSTRYEHKDSSKQVIDKNVAINATVGLEGPPSSEGSAKYVAQNMDGREVAGKTGTSESFKSAWFVGFTPQLVTAVGMFQPSEDGKSEEALTPFGGKKQMTGGSFPPEIWVDIMKPSLEGQDEIDFPEAVAIKNPKKGNGSSGSGSGSATSSQSARPRSTPTQQRTTQAPQQTTQAPQPTQEQQQPAQTTQAPQPTQDQQQQPTQRATQVPQPTTGTDPSTGGGSTTGGPNNGTGNPVDQGGGTGGTDSNNPARQGAGTGAGQQGTDTTGGQ